MKEIGLRNPGNGIDSCGLKTSGKVHYNFTEAELSGTSFSGSDLCAAIFQNTRLSNSDFRSAVNYSINPQENVLSGARFSLPEVVRLLDAYKIRVE